MGMALSFNFYLNELEFYEVSYEIALASVNISAKAQRTRIAA
jgi:hypothetical protein